MSSFNKITIVGYLGRDPELRYTPQGTALCKMSIATTERYLHADVDRLGAVLVRSSPLEQRRKKAAAIRPAMQMILGELQGLVRPE